MRTVTAREANQGFSELLSRVESGEEVVITKHSRPVAVLRPYTATGDAAERQHAIRQAAKVMAEGLPWGDDFRAFSRDEMHES
jgi:prevent-host-death family protein